MKNPPRSVLVIVTRRIGDVLLATPLIRSIKAAWPQTQIDALVFEGAAGVLEGNPDLRRVRAVPERPGLLQHIVFTAQFVRRYDMALSLIPGDRPTLYAFFAARWRAGLLMDRHGQEWKKRLLQRWMAFDDVNTHTVRMNLALTKLLGIEPQATFWLPSSDAISAELDQVCTFDSAQEKFAVLHVYPKFNYKMWHKQGWTELAQWLHDQGMRIVLTGGGDTAEQAYVREIAATLPGKVENLAGRLSLGAACLLASRARLFAGTDTALTHAAAALGAPTVALFGPTNPVKWGPWPKGHDSGSNPWQRCGTQHRGNVVLVQGVGACVPCHHEGCDRHTASYSQCLQELPAARVIAAANTVMQ